MERTFMQLILAWLPYYIFGWVGISFHIVAKLEKGVSPKTWIKNNQRDFWLSVLCYHVIVFLWYDTTMFEFFGMLKNAPTGLTFIAGYAGNSLIGNLLGQFDRRIDDWKTKKINGTT